MLLQSFFNPGELLLGGNPSGEAVLSADVAPLAVSILVVVFLLLSLLLLPRLMDLIPLLFDSLFRARGSSTLENSVRYGIDRRLLCALMLIPTVLILYGFRLYNPAFLRDWPDIWRLAGVAGAFFAFLLLRLLLYWMLMPRRRSENYRLSRATALTYFIVLLLLVMPSLGVMKIIGCDSAVIRLVICIETALVYITFFIRRAQILSLSCNPLRTFLYLCGLELLPTSAWVLSAVLL